MSETLDCNQTLSHPLECLLLGNIYMVFGAVKSNQYKVQQRLSSFLSNLKGFTCKLARFYFAPRPDRA